MASTIRDKVFISYSHKDLEWLEKIQTHLGSIKKTYKILVWDDSRIEVGEKWKEEIAEALDTAKVALLLVSPNFLDSDFIAEHELPKILEAAKKEGLKIIWVAVSSCNYEITDIVNYQAAHDPSIFLDELPPSKQNKILTNLCRQILKSLEQPLNANLPDNDNELGEATSGIIQAMPSSYGTRGILRRYLKGSIYLITDKGKPLAQWPPIENNTAFKIDDSLIGRKYETLGGTGSRLGFPLFGVTKAWDSKSGGLTFVGWTQWFEGGMIYQSERFGAQVMLEGNILTKFREYENYLKQKNQEMTGGRLGFPTTDQYEVSSKTGAKGTVQRFIYGYIIDWSGHAYRVEMGFYDLYQSIGEWNGELGFPLSEEKEFTSAKSGIDGVIQFFENGCMLWNFKENQGYYVYGEIYEKWIDEREKLGYPFNSAIPTKNSHIQHFEGGTIENRSGNCIVSYK